MRIIFIGSGNIAIHHYQALKYLGAEVVGVCTRGEGGKQFAKAHGIPHWNPDPLALAVDVVPDGIFMLTQPRAYGPLLQRLKPLNIPTFVEKPLGYSVQEAEALKPLLPEKVFVGLNRRFYSQVQHLKTVLEGEPPFMAQLVLPERLKDYEHRDLHTRNHWTMLNGIHGIDLMNFLVGYPAVFHHEDHWGDIPQINFSQYHSAFYETDCGNRVSFMSNMDSPGGWRIHCFLRQREYIMSPLETVKLKTLSGVTELLSTEADQRIKPGFVAQAQCFMEGVNNPRCLPTTWVSYGDALRSMKTVEALYGATLVKTTVETA